MSQSRKPRSPKWASEPEILDEIDVHRKDKSHGSRFYQNWLQVVSRGSTIFLFFSGYCLGKGEILAALCLLLFQLGIGFTISELMYKRLQTVVNEGGKDESRR